MVYFALLYGIHDQGYGHLVVTTVAIPSFGAMRLYSDVSRLKWSNYIRFKSNSNSFEINFEMRQNLQFRNGNKAIVAATKAKVCSLKLLRLVQS